MTSETNWAGIHTYQAKAFHKPESVDIARRLVANADRVHGIGSRHSFNDIADSAEIISLERIDPSVIIDRDAMTASAGPSLRYGPFAREIHQAGFALHNMGSLPHISVGGATATATHGSGIANRNLSSAVCAIELITSDGSLITVQRGDPDFEGMVVHIGALGLVTRLTVELQPTYNICQEVLEDLPWEPLIADCRGVFSSGYSVSVFTRFANESAGLLWRKHKVDESWTGPPTTFGATPATKNRHPIDGYDGEICTPQLLQVGPWCELLPYFDIDQTPSAGVEIQTEYMIGIEHAADALRALRDFEPAMRHVLMVSELRTIAADPLWLSTAEGRETLALHFTWYQDVPGVRAILPDLEALLAPFAPRAHWGKVFALDAATLESRYPRYDDFRRLRRRIDPRGAFISPFVERVGLV